MLTSTQLAKAIANAPEHARPKLIERLRHVRAMESLPRLPREFINGRVESDLIGDLAALRLESQAETERLREVLESAGYAVVWSRLLGEHIVVARDPSRVPDTYDGLVLYTADELRMMRDWLRSGPYHLGEVIQLHALKRELAGQVVDASVKALTGLVVGVVHPTQVSLRWVCADGTHRSCRGESLRADSKLVARLTDETRDLHDVWICWPCATQYQWTERAQGQQREFFRKWGPDV